MKTKFITWLNSGIRNLILVLLILILSPAAFAQSDNGLTGITKTEEISFAKAFFFSQGSMLGTGIIWFLLILSAVSIGLMGYMWLDNRRNNILPDRLVAEVKRLTQHREYKALINLLAKDPAYFSQVLSASLKEASHGFGSMVRALEQAGEEFTTRKLRQIELLNVIGNVAPMIGLFGTVYGMILAFSGIVEAGGRPDPVDLAAGIGTALTTTFWGLIVAIPSLAGYALIRNNIDALTSEASLTAEEIINKFRPGTAGAATTTANSNTAASPPFNPK